jgi:hypothetical protein
MHHNGNRQYRFSRVREAAGGAENVILAVNPENVGHGKAAGYMIFTAVIVFSNADFSVRIIGVD